MPCLNEAETLADCVLQAHEVLLQHNINGEIVIADNGSTDNSQAIAAGLGARVVNVRDRGYGSAIMGGIEAARGKFVVMADADGSYNFNDIPLFLKQLRAGFELVMGNRFRGGIEAGAMPALHRYLGNPMLTGIGNLFFHSPCGDFNCGLRAFSKTAYSRMGLRTTGMEFASEMVVKATLMGLKVAEVPTTLSPDGRNRPPHLRSWRDGWRNLRFMLLYSPRWLFFYPGTLLMLVGLLVGAWLLPGPRRLGSITLDVHSLLFASMSILVGFQAIAFATFTKIFAVTQHLLPEDPRLTRLFSTIKLETGLVTGGLLGLVGIVMSMLAVGTWSTHHFGSLDPIRTLRIVIPAGLCLTLGVEIVLASFFLSVLGLVRN